ncbi:MAG: hypothetical protein HYY09_05975, partial [Firmicutes bacterium]|nr:hypothetical protein [Bacillota bacterium]
GYDGANYQSLRTDSGGNVYIRSISDSVTVTATDLDVRNLTFAQDGVAAFGFDGTNYQRLTTDTSGNVQIKHQSRNFTENSSTSVLTGNSFTGILPTDVSSVGKYTFFVKNTSTNSADLRLEISPNSTDWYVDVTTVAVDGNTSEVVTPNRFLRYARLSYKSTTTDASTTLDLFYQAQV